MSEPTAAPQNGPIRKAQPTRRSASGPGDRIVSARDAAIYLREDCRDLDDSLTLEMVVAQYVLQLRAVRTSAGVPVGDIAGSGVIAELEGHGDELSHAILRAVGQLAADEIAVRAADAAARLTERGVGLPRKFGDVAAVAPLGAWRTSEGAHPGEYVLFADFAHALGRRHSIAMFVEPHRGGLVKHLGLMSALRDLEDLGPFHPDAMESLRPPEAATLMHEVLERTYGPAAEAADDYRALLANARARTLAAPLADAAQAVWPVQA
jgi:hypothetical protein